MTTAIAPGRAHAIINASNALMVRIGTNIAPAVRSLHDQQPGYPSAPDGPQGRGGHSDPTSSLAFNRDPARDALEETSTLVLRIAADLTRLDHLCRNWTGPSDKWRKALATEAATKLDDGNWCATHQQAGSLERTKNPGGRLCEWCQGVRRDINGDPPPWLVEKRISGRRINSQDITRAKKERKPKRKGKH